MQGRWPVLCPLGNSVLQQGPTPGAIPQMSPNSRVSSCHTSHVPKPRCPPPKGRMPPRHPRGNWSIHERPHSSRCSAKPSAHPRHPTPAQIQHGSKSPWLPLQIGPSSHLYCCTRGCITTLSRTTSKPLNGALYTLQPHSPQEPTVLSSAPRPPISASPCTKRLAPPKSQGALLPEGLCPCRSLYLELSSSTSGPAPVFPQPTAPFSEASSCPLLHLSSLLLTHHISLISDLLVPFEGRLPRHQNAFSTWRSQCREHARWREEVRYTVERWA